VNDYVSPRSLIAKLCILGMLLTFVIVVPVVRADYWANCDYCSTESQCESIHFQVEIWYADKDRCIPECDTQKANRDSQCESNKNAEEQAAPEQCTNNQTGELDQNCLSQRMTQIQTEYFNCTDSSEWQYNGCLQYCDDRFSDPPEDCTCAYFSCANGCCL
jgi:hypothetical protein